MTELATIKKMDVNSILKKCKIGIGNKDKAKIKDAGKQVNDASDLVNHTAQDEVNYSENESDKANGQGNESKDQEVTADNAGSVGENTLAQGDMDQSFLDDLNGLTEEMMKGLETKTQDAQDFYTTSGNEASSNAGEVTLLVTDNENLLAKIKEESNSNSMQGLQGQDSPKDNSGFQEIPGSDGTGAGVKSAYSLATATEVQEEQASGNSQNQTGIPPSTGNNNTNTNNNTIPPAGNNNNGSGNASNYLSQIEANSSKINEINTRTNELINQTTAQMEADLAETEAQMKETETYSEANQQILDNCAKADAVIDTVNTVGQVTEMTGTALVVTSKVIHGIGTGVQTTGGTVKGIGGGLTALGAALLPGLFTAPAGGATASAGGATTGAGFGIFGTGVGITGGATGLEGVGVATKNIGTMIGQVGSAAGIVVEGVKLGVEISEGNVDNILTGVTSLASNTINLVANVAPAGGTVAEGAKKAAKIATVASSAVDTGLAIKNGESATSIAAKGLGTVAATAGAVGGYSKDGGTTKHIANIVEKSANLAQSGVGTYDAAKNYAETGEGLGNVITSGLNTLSSATALGKEATTNSTLWTTADAVVNGAKVVNTTANAAINITEASKNGEINVLNIINEGKNVMESVQTFNNSVNDAKDVKEAKTKAKAEKAEADANPTKKEAEEPKTKLEEAKMKNDEINEEIKTINEEIDENNKTIKDLKKALKSAKTEADLKEINEKIEGLNKSIKSKREDVRSLTHEKIIVVDYKNIGTGVNTALESVNKLTDVTNKLKNTKNTYKAVEENIKLREEAKAAQLAALDAQRQNLQDRKDILAKLEQYKNMDFEEFMKTLS